MNRIQHTVRYIARLILLVAAPRLVFSQTSECRWLKSEAMIRGTVHAAAPSTRQSVSSSNPANERAIVAELMLIVFSLFITGRSVLLQAQTGPADSQPPAVRHNSWGKGPAMPTAVKFPMTGVIGSDIYVVGGVTNTTVVAKNQVYDPVTNEWSGKAPLPQATCDAASAVVKNVLYVFGGSNDGVTVTNAVWAYNPTTNKWSARSSMPTPRASVGATVENNRIYVIGGTDGHIRFNTVESYDPGTDTWREEAPLAVGKSEPSVGLVETTIVAADGFSSSGDTGDNEGYNASVNSWKSLAADPRGRNEACAGSISGRLYVAGGSQNGATNNTNINESFNQSTNKWATLAPIPHPVAAAGSAVDRGLLYCIGGGDTTVSFQGKVFNLVQIYQP